MHPQCDPVTGLDPPVSLDEQECDEEYKRKFPELFPSEATLRCQSPHHNEDSVRDKLSKGVVWIKAVPQDGVPECWRGVDEDPAPWYFKYITPGEQEEVFNI